MLQRLFYITIFTGFSVQAFTQDIKYHDSTAKRLEEIFITATRTPNSEVTIPLPIQVITRKVILASGIQKLVDILQQQTGLILADNPLGAALQGYPNPFGSGIQMQGLDPAYSLILVDGEPLTGRNAGILNLERISTGNIRQIEIVKGPSTSLYGSAAMAGVINIITEKPDSNTASLRSYYASNNTLSLSADASIRRKKTGLQFFVNRFSSDGFDLDKNIYGKTVDPSVTYSFNTKLYQQIGERSELQTSVRMYNQKQFNKYRVYTLQQPENVKGTTTEGDQSFSARYKHFFSDRLRIASTFYASWYNNHSEVFTDQDHELFEKVFLNQLLIKPEVQFEAGEKSGNKFITGIGYNSESINSSRYTRNKNLSSWYLYSQDEWHCLPNTNVILGARADKSSLYDLQLSPKIAIGYKFHKLLLNGSIGTGFKTPDFRQLYLNFTNSLVGYTLLGANELGFGLSQLKKNGEIDQNVDITPYLVPMKLVPEKSLGINLGFQYLPFTQTNIKVNIFRNDIRNLIETYNLPFTKVNGQAIFSYLNVSKVFTEGFDINITHSLTNNLKVSGGYQFLVARDKDVVDEIKHHVIYKRDPEPPYTTSLVSNSDYQGLFNRSKNTANLQLNYQSLKRQFGINLRTTYRGRFGYGDVNGDNILDDDREFAGGYVMLNATVNKKLIDGIDVQVGSENILNYTDRQRLPNLSGRTFFITCNFKLENLNN